MCVMDINKIKALKNKVKVMLRKRVSADSHSHDSCVIYRTHICCYITVEITSVLSYNTGLYRSRDIMAFICISLFTKA